MGAYPWKAPVGWRWVLIDAPTGYHPKKRWVLEPIK